VDATGLDPGQYYGQVEIDAPGADNSPQLSLIVLNVLPPGSDPGPIVQPAGMIFTGAALAESPGSQVITAANLTSAPLPLTVNVATLNGGNWLTVVPGQAIVAPGGVRRIVAQPTTGNLAPGVYQATVTLQFGGGVNRAVNLVFVVGSGGLPNPKARRHAQGACPSQLVPRFTSFASGVTVAAGWPTALSVNVVDDCGAPMLSGSVVAQFSNGDPPAVLTPAGDGTWFGTWQAAHAASAVNIKVTAQDPDRQLAGTVEIAGGVSTNPDPPVVNSGGVVSAASLTQQAPLAPGSLISIFGSHLSAGSNAAQTLPWPNDMGGTEVQIQGRFLPIMTATDGRIDAVLPYDLPVNTRLPLVVRRGSSLAVPQQITIAPAVPAIFTQDNSGSGQGLIFNQLDNSAPIHSGDTVVIQCTGLGAVTPAATAGTAAPASPPITATIPVGVNIGGIDAQVTGAILQPGLTGMYQVTAKVPANVQTGNAVQVFLTVAGQTSPGVTIAVQ
jgi:uncharacterized protein (TIGR03437 family)